jgi:hypothetical protein
MKKPVKKKEARIRPHMGKAIVCTQCDEKATVDVQGKPYCPSCGIVAAIHVNNVGFPFLASKKKQ